MFCGGYKVGVNVQLISHNDNIIDFQKHYLLYSKSEQCAQSSNPSTVIIYTVFMESFFFSFALVD